MINRAVLVGRLTRDPELRYTGSGVAVATFTVAVNRQFTNSQGEREADFINCVMWRKAAENFCNFTRKGSLVGIDGRIQTRSYENQQGTRVYVTEVVAENFSLLESKNSNQNNGQNYQNQQNGQSAPSRNPNDPFNSMPDIKDDDLPF
ncbi:single-stranded DNA-binding protein [Pediococcus pentosaceus]|uniref:single-stranded DNA-binding protein n=1 Tax=Pediococcus pentosaceus TaxID=1255 RepID=UPI0020182C06|nr:single-stranded DNA-binding protein [Pediococcus pentosaceus]MCL3857909.1 single-stranded DNA-binding protein [Pediococcus pentosaceus]